MQQRYLIIHSLQEMIAVLDWCRKQREGACRFSPAWYLTRKSSKKTYACPHHWQQLNQKKANMEFWALEQSSFLNTDRTASYLHQWMNSPTAMVRQLLEYEVCHGWNSDVETSVRLLRFNCT
jgi:hypothetical protein